MELVLELTPESRPASLRAEGRLPSTSDAKPCVVDRVLGTPAAAAHTQYDDCWTSLVEAASAVAAEELRSWRNRARALVVPVAVDEHLEAAERRTQRRRLAVPTVVLPALGQFDPTALDDVRIVPRSADDARAWAEWLVWDGITSYATPDRLTEIAREVATRFPDHRPPVPSPADLLRRAQSDPADSHARYVLAPSDLGLWR
jgi:hypothetical protein